MAFDELALLLWRESDHAKSVAAVKRREDPRVHPEIRVPHVGRFNGTLQRQCDAPEIVWRHTNGDCKALRESA